jgi:glutamate/tyrosine decarboxylase-like PLP-dependent enzyme
MHSYTDAIDLLADELVNFARWRTRLEPIPLGRPARPADLARAAGRTITEDGIGGHEALRIFREVLAPACLSPDFTRYLAFVPAAPTETAVLFDLVVAAFSIYGGSWLEGGGAVHAENEALRWLSELVGLPPEAGGCFVSGGTLGNLSALVAARHDAELHRSADRPRPARWAFAATSSAHSSVISAAQVMDAEVVEVQPDADGRLSAFALADVLDRDGDRIFAVVATTGTTNIGLIDDLATVGPLCRDRGVWLHVDGAYGGAALAAPSARAAFAGIEHADSFIVDPHKWLFSPFDCCALLYRAPEAARRAHGHHAPYLEILSEHGEWNPSDYAIHLTRRARGLPFWFSLATHGTLAYQQAIETTLTVARAAADEIRRRSYLELVVEPSLSIVVFRRCGWGQLDYRAWSERMLMLGEAFVVPTTHEGESVLRLCIINPRTTTEDIVLILDSLE